MVPRIGADEDHVDRPVAIVCVFIHGRIVCRRKPCSLPALLPVALEDAGEVADHPIVGGEIGAGGRSGPPGNRSTYATGKLSDEAARIPERIEVVEHVRAMVLDLAEQNLLEA